MTAPTTLATTVSPVYEFATDDLSIYWADVFEGTVRRVAKAGGASEIVVALQDTQPMGVAVDDDFVYLRTGKDLRRIAKAGGNVVTLAATATPACDVSVDAVQLYWVDDVGPWAVPKAGGTPRALATALHARHQLTSDDRYVYDSGDDATGAMFWRVPVTGGAPTRLGGMAGVLTLDCSTLYWAGSATNDIYPDAIYKMPKSGGSAVMVAPLSHPGTGTVVRGLTGDSAALYWSESWIVARSFFGAIWRTSKADGQTTQLATEELPMAVAVDDRCVYWLRVIGNNTPGGHSEIVAAPLP